MYFSGLYVVARGSNPRIVVARGSNPKLLEEPRGLGPAEDYTNLHKNIESKGCIELLPPEIFYVSSPKILLKVTF